MSSIRCTAFILARGGSKRIKRKNMQLLAGQPLLFWTIKYAEVCPHIGNTILSSDDTEILEYASQFSNVTTIKRPENLATDISPDLEAFDHCLRMARMRDIPVNEYVVHLRATNPFRKLFWMDEIVATLRDNPEIDTVRSIEPAATTPYKMWHQDDRDFLEPVCTAPEVPFAHSMPKQLLPDVYWQNAHLDIIRKDVLLSNRIVGDKIYGYRTVGGLPDIDLPLDLETARDFFADLVDGKLL